MGDLPSAKAHADGPCTQTLQLEIAFGLLHGTDHGIQGTNLKHAKSSKNSIQTNRSVSTSKSSQTEKKKKLLQLVKLHHYVHTISNFNLGNSVSSVTPTSMALCPRSSAITPSAAQLLRRSSASSKRRRAWTKAFKAPAWNRWSFGPKRNQLVDKLRVDMSRLCQDYNKAIIVNMLTNFHYSGHKGL